MIKARQTLARTKPRWMDAHSIAGWLLSRLFLSLLLRCCSRRPIDFCNSGDDESRRLRFPVTPVRDRYAGCFSARHYHHDERQ